MMSEQERVEALRRMRTAVDRFYGEAVQIGNHPFIEFAGLMTAYVNSCRLAHADGVDFTECNVHAGRLLPMESFEIAYVAEKLGCIFGGRVAAIRDDSVCLSGSVAGVDVPGRSQKDDAPLEVRFDVEGGREVRISGLSDAQAQVLAGRVGGQVSLVVVDRDRVEHVVAARSAA